MEYLVPVRCAISIAYAVRHPERVAHLILLGGFALGSEKRAQSEAEKEHLGGAAAKVMMSLLVIWRHGEGFIEAHHLKPFTRGGCSRGLRYCG